MDVSLRVVHRLVVGGWWLEMDNLSAHLHLQHVNLPNDPVCRSLLLKLVSTYFYQLQGPGVAGKAGEGKGVPPMAGQRAAQTSHGTPAIS